jgi:hypothetical protein
LKRLTQQTIDDGSIRIERAEIPDVSTVCARSVHRKSIR